MDGISDEPNHELVDFTKRLWISAGAAVPLLILTMGPMVGLPIREWFGETLSMWIELVLATPVVLVGGRSVLSARLVLDPPPGTSTCGR